MDKITLGLLGIWAFLYGLVTVTNIRVEAADAIMHWSALILGVVCIIRVVASCIPARPAKP